MTQHITHTSDHLRSDGILSGPRVRLSEWFGPITLSVFMTFGTLFATPSIAQESEPPSVSSEPCRFPDRIVLTLTEDPAHSLSVNWRTSADVGEAIAEITLATDGPDFSEEVAEVAAETQKLETEAHTAHYHAVTFGNLEPDTAYLYRVGDGEYWSPWFQYRTPPEEIESFSFLYFGDAQNSIRTHWSRLFRQSILDHPQADFLVHAGDLVNRGENDVHWEEWFQAGDWVFSTIPSVPVPGNHEHPKRDDGTRYIAPHWRAVFNLPEHGPEGLKEMCYTLCYGNMRFVCLSSTQHLEVQTDWLEKVLAENEHPWVVCVFHHPIFSSGKDRDNPELRKAWKPLFEKYGVDLVLQGHDHTYARTGLETPASHYEISDFDEDGAEDIEMRTGTVYVNSVSGPKMYTLNPKPFMVSTAGNTQLYQVIRVEGDTLHFEAKTVTGKLHDAFMLRKDESGAKQLIERGR